MRQLIVVCALIFLVQMIATKTYADCEPIYGGGTSCQPAAVSLSKTIFDPVSNSYVHDIGVNELQFRPGDVLTFKISVTNTGNGTIGPIQIVDQLPPILTFAQGTGTVNRTANSLAMATGSLASGQTQTFVFTTQILGSGTFPTNQDSQCFTNLATATAADGTTTQDSSQFCVFHPLPASPAPATTVPPSTGANQLVVFLFVPLGTVGLLLNKRARKEQSYGIS